MKLFLFTTDLNFSQKTENAGIDSIIVDWEVSGKEERQKRADLEINADTPEDVERLSKELKIPITVRINSFGDHTQKEIDCALKYGARILMLPMAKTLDEVNNFLAMVDGRAQTIIQIETPELVFQVEAMKELTWDYAYIGLNDLMVARNGGTIWEAVIDGTVERICKALKGRNIGFGGVTVLGGGSPINFELLLHEMTRLHCNLSFLRRAFKKEILDRDIQGEIQAIKTFVKTSHLRGPQAVEFDRERLYEVIKKLVYEKDKRRGVLNA